MAHTASHFGCKHSFKGGNKVITESYLDSLNLMELKELYMELWLSNNKEVLEVVFNYLTENYPWIYEEGI
jgi:hypothetical protein